MVESRPEQCPLKLGPPCLDIKALLHHANSPVITSSLCQIVMRIASAATEALCAFSFQNKSPKMQ